LLYYINKFSHPPQKRLDFGQSSPLTCPSKEFHLHLAIKLKLATLASLTPRSPSYLYLILTNIAMTTRNLKPNNLGANHSWLLDFHQMFTSSYPRLTSIGRHFISTIDLIYLIVFSPSPRSSLNGVVFSHTFVSYQCKMFLY